MVVDKVIVETTSGLLKRSCSDARRAGLRATRPLAQEYLIAFATVRLDTAVSIS